MLFYLWLSFSPCLSTCLVVLLLFYTEIDAEANWHLVWDFFTWAKSWSVYYICCIYGCQKLDISLVTLLCFSSWLWRFSLCFSLRRLCLPAIIHSPSCSLSQLWSTVIFTVGLLTWLDRVRRSGESFLIWIIFSYFEWISSLYIKDVAFTVFLFILQENNSPLTPTPMLLNPFLSALCLQYPVCVLYLSPL